MRRRFNRRRFNPKNRGMEGMPVSHSSNPRRANVVTSRNTNSNSRENYPWEGYAETQRWLRRDTKENYCRGSYGWYYTPIGTHPSGWEVPGNGYLPIGRTAANSMCQQSYLNDYSGCTDCWINNCQSGAINDVNGMCYIHSKQIYQPYGPNPNLDYENDWWPRQFCNESGICQYNQGMIPEDWQSIPGGLSRYIKHFGFVSAFECAPTGACGTYNQMLNWNYYFDVSSIPDSEGSLHPDEETYSAYNLTRVMWTREMTQLHCNKDPRCYLNGDVCQDYLTHSGPQECDSFNDPNVRFWIDSTCNANRPGDWWQNSCNLWNYTNENGQSENCKVITRLGNQTCVYGRYSCEDEGLITGPGDCGCVTQLSDCEEDSDGGENNPPEICCEIQAFNCQDPSLVYNSGFPDDAVEGEDYVCNSNLCKYCVKCTHGGPSFGTVTFSPDFDSTPSSGVGDGSPEHDKTYGSCPEQVCCRDFIVREHASIRTMAPGYNGPLTNYVEYLDGEQYIHSCQSSEEQDVFGGPDGCCGAGGTGTEGDQSHGGGKSCPCDKTRDCSGECSCDRFNTTNEGQQFPGMNYPNHPMHCYTGVCDPITDRGKVKRHENHVTYCNGVPGGNVNGAQPEMGNLDAELAESNSCSKGEEHMVYDGPMHPQIQYVFSQNQHLLYQAPGGGGLGWGPEFWSPYDREMPRPWGCNCEHVTAYCRSGTNEVAQKTHCVHKEDVQAKRFYVYERGDYLTGNEYDWPNTSTYNALLTCQNHCEAEFGITHDHGLIENVPGSNDFLIGPRYGTSRRDIAECMQYPSHEGTNEAGEVLTGIPIYYQCVQDCTYVRPIPSIIHEGHSN